jgi:hypothetical protein
MGETQHRLIFLADQPHEAKFIAPIASELLKNNGQMKFSFAFTDYYTFLSRQDFLKGIEAGFPGEVVHLGQIYKAWQEEKAEPFIDFDFLEQWEKDNCADRTLDEIERTNQLVYADERSQWHMPINDAWKKKVLVDTIKWCEEYLEGFRPSAIVSVGNATLATNILYTLAKKNQIPFFTFFPSRIGNRIVIREDFAYGVTEELYAEALELSKDEILNKKAVDLAFGIAQQKRGAYDSYQVNMSEHFSSKKKRLLTSFFHDFRKFLGRTYARTFIYKRLYEFPVKRIGENLLKMTFYDLRRILFQYLRLIGVFNYGTKEVPSEKYFLWALHMRPEGAVSTLGDGRDEIVELVRCAELLPKGYFMAVKENPEMFGQRRQGFHRKLKRHPKIILLDPYSPIFPLIESSVGVIGISGTVLLEATILDKPACALGHPEFDRFLTNSGWNSAPNFIEKCISGVYVGALNKMLPYLCYIIHNSDERDAPPWHDWLGEFERDKIKETTKRLALQLSNKLNSKIG